MNDRELFQEWLDSCPVQYTRHRLLSDTVDYRFYFKEDEDDNEEEH